MERKCVSRRFRRYNPGQRPGERRKRSSRLHPRPEDPAPIYSPNSCGAGGAKYKEVDSRLRGNDNVVPSAALRAGLPTTAKQKPHVKREAKYYGFGISSLGISLRNSPTIFGTIMILAGSVVRIVYNHIAVMPLVLKYPPT
jgi:hypothetical protein